MPKLEREPSPSERWYDYEQKFSVFGPLLEVDDVPNAKKRIFLKYTPIEWDALHKFSAYATGFLAKPHPDLGRTGNVCPFVPSSIAKNLFRLTSTLATDVAQVKAAMEIMKNVFLQMAPLDGDESGLKTIIVIFPNIPSEAAGEVIGDLQKKLKATYINSGLMIGEFYPGCPEPGLHNEHFRPLQTPVAALAIRKITAFDLPFMLGDISFLNGYLARFKEEGLRQINLMIKKNNRDTGLGHTH